MTQGGGGRSRMEQRRETRLTVRLAAALLVYRHRYEVVLVDLSNGGAMVTGEEDMPALGDEVVLACAGLEVVATVAWRAGANAGLAFHRAIDAAATVRRFERASRLI